MRAEKTGDLLKAEIAIREWIGYVQIGEGKPLVLEVELSLMQEIGRQIARHPKRNYLCKGVEALVGLKTEEGYAPNAEEAFACEMLGRALTRRHRPRLIATHAQGFDIAMTEEHLIQPAQATVHFLSVDGVYYVTATEMLPYEANRYGTLNKGPTELSIGIASPNAPGAKKQRSKNEAKKRKRKQADKAKKRNRRKPR